MTRKETGLVVLVLALGAMYAIYFTDWFKPKVIHVGFTVRPVYAAAARPLPFQPRTAGPATYSVTFAMDREYRLTAVQVVQADMLATNANAPALWRLTAPGRTVPIKGFAYAAPLPGMMPFLPGAEPRPLQPGVNYRLLVEAGRYRGQCDFKVGQ
jgi:hypothetical protein